MKNLPPFVKNKQGQRYGRLVVLDFVEVKNRKAQWMCLCDCGNKTVISSGNLRVGKAKSCGCLIIENCRAVGLMRPSGSTTLSGLDRDRLQKIFRGMIDRCTKPSRKAYKDYGARGISVCNEWASNFDTFYEWAKANDYQPDLTIDRINVNDNYCPGNCRWATKKQQAQNTRTNRRHEAFGTVKILTEWLRDDRCLVSKPTIDSRLAKGWSFESAISTPGMSKSKSALYRWSKR